jgi:hypothetical protein
MKLEARWAEPVSLICHFVFEETLYRTFHRCCLPNWQFFFLVGQFLKSSLKPFGQIKQHFTGIIWKVLYKISPFYPDWTKTLSPWAIPVSDWLKLKKKSMFFTDRDKISNLHR